MNNFEGAFRVNCEIIFNDRSPEEGKIGFCVITRPSPHIENDKLSLLIHIWDKTGVWRNKSYNALQDAAISGNQFLHFLYRYGTVSLFKGAAPTPPRGLRANYQHPPIRDVAEDHPAQGPDVGMET
jgi:hypothetical protein